jgi:PAS domain S-box-containing protein
LANAEATIQEYLDGKTTIYVSEYRVLCKDGSYKWILDRGMVVSRSEDGKPLRMLGTHRDITQSKLAEEALRISALKYQTLFESSRDALMMVSPPSWKFTGANPATLQLFGAASEAEFGMLGPWDVSPERQPDGRLSSEKAQEMMAIALREGSYLFEWEHQRLDGQSFPADVLLTRIEAGEERFLQASVRNISQRKKAEQELRLSEERLSIITSSAHNGIIMLDEAGNIAFWNQAKGYSGAPGKRLSGAICTICLLPSASGKRTFGPSRIFSKPVRELPSARHLSLPGCARTKASSLWSYHSPQCRLKTPGIDRYTA